MARRLFSSAASLKRLRRFELERHPLWWTPGVEHLCASDIEPLTLGELLSYEQSSRRCGNDDALAELQQLSLGYPDSQGSLGLRTAIAAMHGGAAGGDDGQHGGDGGTVAADDVTVLAPQEGILLAMLAMCDPGTRVVAATPCYQSLTEVARSIGCEVVPWRVRGTGGAGGAGGAGGSGAAMPWRFDVEELRTLLPGASVLVLNFPHNPTGALLSHTEWAEVGALCERHGVRIFSDEMYRGLELGTAARQQLCSAVEMGERHVALSGLSKWAALPGLRAGWLVARDAALVAEVNRLKDYTTICPAAPTEHLAALALRQRKQLLRRSHEHVARGLAAARAFGVAHEDWLRWREPLAGSVCFPELRGGEGGAPPPSAARWCEEVARRAGIMMLPSTLFGDGEGDACFRIGLGRANVAELLSRLDADVKKNGPPR